ncbi:hypothetical protein [Paraburkholderia lycopersici]|uniref:Uncharacterized protein n=1 Tax=Paraburkholderia lycopersici TaxID=416944 RepID=A0A1G6GNP8_9BURK|nr:hypothetical protein [Paraburkholderia lycopersici]SDB83630.1 hypothetical protein SAMN05421548_101144 [Paraburkholderia lycopersici]
MTRTMTMTLKTMGAGEARGEAAAMVRTRAQGTQLVRRAVGFAVVASGLVALAVQGLAHFAGH